MKKKKFFEITTNLYTVESHDLLVISVDFFERKSHSYIFGLGQPESADSDSGLVLKYLKKQLTLPESGQLYWGKYNCFKLKLTEKSKNREKPTTARRTMPSEC